MVFVLPTKQTVAAHGISAGREINIIYLSGMCRPVRQHRAWTSGLVYCLADSGVSNFESGIDALIRISRN